MEKLIEGGIPRGSFVLVSGDHGTGKTVLGMQYLVRGITDYGEFGVLATFVDDRKDLLATSNRFGPPPRKNSPESRG